MLPDLSLRDQQLSVMFVEKITKLLSKLSLIRIAVSNHNTETIAICKAIRIAIRMNMSNMFVKSELLTAINSTLNKLKRQSRSTLD